jgi:hypothetical protein
MIYEVDINDVSISPSDEDINVDNKIKRAREDDNIIDEVENKNGREYPLTGRKTGI